MVEQADIDFRVRRVYRRGFINQKKIRQRKKIGVDKKPCKTCVSKYRKGEVKITYPVVVKKSSFFSETKPEKDNGQARFFSHLKSASLKGTPTRRIKELHQI